MRVLIVDKHPLCASALKGLITDCDGMFPQDVTICGSPTEALERAAALRPGLTIWDADTAQSLGKSWMSTVASSGPGALIIDQQFDGRLREKARLSGMAGYVTRTSSIDALRSGISAALRGAAYFETRASEASDPVTETGRSAHLSPRQAEVLTELERGQTNKEIAASLGISVATVKLHVQAILRVLGAKNRTEAATYNRPRR